ncbi:MAG: FkbM family methyltransferase [Candidatus Rokubacteria bacterium]|nr:FkbM family methyltransferase [Candidatus Rokubacteria bacterium]
MIDLSAIRRESVLGRALRAPLRLIPPATVLPIAQGPLRGARWIVGSATHGCWLGCYEAEKQRLCVAYARPGMTVFDLGANVGFYTLLFSRLVGAAGTVHAFEPVERNLGYLRKHLALNGVSNAHVHPVAAGRRTGRADFDPSRDPRTGRVVSAATPSTLTVPVGSLDDFVYREGHPPPQLVKIDVKGGEGDVLDGSDRLLSEERPTLFVAIHGLDQWRRCYELLTRRRYRIEDLKGVVLDRDIEHDEIVATPG